MAVNRITPICHKCGKPKTAVHKKVDKAFKFVGDTFLYWGHECDVKDEKIPLYEGISENQSEIMDNLNIEGYWLHNNMEMEADERELNRLRLDKEKSNSFIKGFACALVILLKEERQITPIARAMFSAGIGSIKRAKEAGVDEYDLKELMKYFI